MDQKIDEFVKTPDEFVANFKGIRTKRKDIEKLPDQEKIGCCTISILPLKSQLEDLLHRFNDSLLIALRRCVTVNYVLIPRKIDFEK